MALLLPSALIEDGLSMMDASWLAAFVLDWVLGTAPVEDRLLLLT